MLALVRGTICAGQLWNSRCRSGPRHCQGFHLEQQAIHPAHHYRLAGGQVGGGYGVPQFAVNEYLAARSERGLGNASLADQSLRP